MQEFETLHKQLHHNHHINTLLLHASGNWRIVGYVSLAIGIFLEGDAVLFTAGFLSHQGLFDPVFMFLWLLLGSTIGDVAWYQLGAWLEPKNNWLVRWLKTVTNPLGPHLLERPKRSLFISKFLYGVNHAILAKAGALGMPLADLMRKDLPGNIAWIIIVGGLGYASSAGVVHLGRSLRYAEMGLLLGIILLMSISRIFTYFFKKKI